MYLQGIFLLVLGAAGASACLTYLKYQKNEQKKPALRAFHVFVAFIILGLGIAACITGLAIIGNARI